MSGVGVELGEIEPVASGTEDVFEPPAGTVCAGGALVGGALVAGSEGFGLGFGATVVG